MGPALLAASTTNAAPASTAPPVGTPPAAATEAHQNKLLAFLSKADQDRVLSAHSKAVADNPALKTEGDSLKQDRPDMQSATPEELMEYMEKAQAYQQKLREAMLKEDPGLGPILDQIDKHMSEMRAKRAQSMSAGGGTNAAAPTNAAPAH